MKEREGNYMEAISLYLKAGLPAKAARLAMSREVGLSVLLFVASREGRDALLIKGTFLAREFTRKLKTVMYIQFIA